MAILNVEAYAVTKEVLQKLQVMEHMGRLRFRAAETAECEALGLLPAKALQTSVENSVEAYVVLIEGKVAAVWGFGVSSPLGECCYPWIMTTELVAFHKKRYARSSKRVVEYLLSRFPRAQVMVDCRLATAIGWLEWLGFDAHPASIPVGPKGTPFLIMTVSNEKFDGVKEAWVH